MIALQMQHEEKPTSATSSTIRTNNNNNKESNNLIPPRRHKTMVPITVGFRNTIELFVPEEVIVMRNDSKDDEMKEWILENCKKQIFDSIFVRSSGYDNNNSSSSSNDSNSNNSFHSTTDLTSKPRSKSSRMEPIDELSWAQKPCSYSSISQVDRLNKEIRTPMVSITNLANVLKDMELDEFQKEAAQTIKDRCDMLVDSIDSMLEYAALDSGVIATKIKLINLQETLNSIVDEKKTLAKEYKDITLTTEFDATVPEFLTTDGRKLQQTLSHLINNAVKFSPNNSIITLSSIAIDINDDNNNRDCRYRDYIDEDVENDIVAVHVHNPLPTTNDNEPILRFSIKNYGRYISQSDLERIFLPYEQAKVRADEDTIGMGLGLPIVSRLVHDLNGRLSVRCSQKQKEVEFRVDVPLLGNEVQVKSFIDKLKGTTVFLVTKDIEDDAIVTVLAKHGLNIFKFDSCKAVEINMNSKNLCICLVQEDLYASEIFQRIQSEGTCALLTFGPKRSVTEAKCHFSSLRQTLPSVLLESMAACVDVTPAPRSSPKRAGSDNNTPRPLNFDFDGLRTLIVEDNTINQKVLQRMLRRLGVRDIDLANHGQEGIDCCNRKQYDIVFMDNQMPIKDGLEACYEIMNKDGPRPEIVFVTASVSDRFKQQAYRSGGNGFITKPFNVRSIESYFRFHTKLYRPINSSLLQTH